MKGVRERLVVELDEAASKLLRQHMEGKSELGRHPGDDPRAVASAAVCFMFTTDAQCPEVIKEAVKRLEAREGKPVVQQHPPIAVHIDVEAAELLARYARKTGHDARDLASGAVYQLMAALLGIGTFNSQECIRSARCRRYSRAERATPTKAANGHQRKEAA